MGSRRSRAVVADGSGGHAVETIEVAAPGPGEVLVEIAASGVCHTDHQLAGSATSPHVMGHEGAGVVVSVGEGVDRVNPGDRVLLTWAISCGSCFNCVRGLEVLCEVLGLTPAGHAHPGATLRDGRPIRRSFHLGTMSDFTVVRQEAVVPLDQPIPMTSACILGCGVMTGFGSVANAARVRQGESVVVIGCGGVGLNAVQAARILGASPIIAVDLTPERLETARRFGATDVVLAAGADAEMAAVVAAVRELTGGRGADHAFECTAVPQMAAAPLRVTRHGGTAVQVSGVEEDIVIDMRLFEWDRTYINPLYGQCSPARDFPRLLQLYASGALMLDELVTRTYRLEDIDSAFDDMLQGRNAKGVLAIRPG